MVNEIITSQEDYLTIVNKDYEYVSASKSYLTIMGLSPQNIIGKKIHQIWKDVIVQNQIVENIDKALSGKEVIYRGRFTLKNNKSWYRVKYSPLVEINGSIEKIIISTQDITNQVKSIDNLIKSLKRDKLTNVFNRAAFENDIKEQHSKNTPYNLMLFDLDNFKSVNDNFGHNAGDLALVESAKIFKKALGRYGKVYRIGGDEFMAISKKTTKPELEKISKKILSELRDATFNKNFKLGVSIGILIIKNPSKMPLTDQIKTVDKNMYFSKKSGKNRFTLLEI